MVERVRGLIVAMLFEVAIGRFRAGVQAAGDPAIGQAAASTSAQNERPEILLQMLRRRSTSSMRPEPAMIRSWIFTSQLVPSRHGVHLPHDS